MSFQYFICFQPDQTKPVEVLDSFIFQSDALDELEFLNAEYPKSRFWISKVPAKFEHFHLPLTL
jgi:hypothetical protein